MTERASYWSGLLKEWEGSGLSQAEFCRRRGVKAVTFAWWKRQWRQGRVSSSRQAASIGVSKRHERLVRPEPVRHGEACRSRAGARPAKGSGRFVEVRLTSPSPSYEVVLAGGRSIRVPSPFDPESLSRLITAVESAGVHESC